MKPNTSLGNISNNTKLDSQSNTQITPRKQDITPDSFQKNTQILQARAPKGRSGVISQAKADKLLAKPPASISHEEKTQVVSFLVHQVNDKAKEDLIKHGHISNVPGSSVVGNINPNSLAYKCEDCAPYLANEIEKELHKHGLDESVGINVGVGYEQWTGGPLGHTQ